MNRKRTGLYCHFKSDDWFYFDGECFYVLSRIYQNAWEWILNQSDVNDYVSGAINIVWEF